MNLRFAPRGTKKMIKPEDPNPIIIKLNRLADLLNGLKARCKTKSNHAYKYYGSKGIKVYQPWCEKKTGTQDFVTYMVSLYPDIYSLLDQGYQIDRIDVNGNYEPGNVRMVTQTQNANNKSNNFYVIYKGERMSIADAMRASGCKLRYSTIYARIAKNGMTVEEALSKPIRQTKTGPIKWSRLMVFYEGKEMPLYKAHEISNSEVALSTVRKRIEYHNWTIEEALFTPVYGLRKDSDGSNIVLRNLRNKDNMTNQKVTNG